MSYSSNTFILSASNFYYDDKNKRKKKKKEKKKKKIRAYLICLHTGFSKMMFHTLN